MKHQQGTSAYRLHLQKIVQNNRHLLDELDHLIWTVPHQWKLECKLSIRRDVSVGPGPSLTLFYKFTQLWGVFNLHLHYPISSLNTKVIIGLGNECK